MRINHSFHAAARARLSTLWQQFSPLFELPFELSRRDLLFETELYLADIGDTELSSFSSAIGSGALAQLTRLELESNRIGDAGMSSFSSAIGSGALSQLEEFFLNGNQIGDAGLASFAQALGSGALAQLETVDFGRNPASKEARERIEQILRDRRDGSR